MTAAPPASEPLNPPPGRGWPLRRILDVALVLAVAFTLLRISSQPDTRTPQASENLALTPTIRVGDTLRLSGVRWSADRSVVLVLSSTCPACNANLPFYKVLATAAGATPVIAVSAEASDVLAAWLRANGVPIPQVHQVSNPPAHGFTLTPMVVMVDREGRVTDVMIRKLDESDQARVIDRMRGVATSALDNSRQIREISVTELARPSLSPPLVLDVRPREEFRAGHRSQARNIPLGELRARAPIELDAAAPVVLDCLQPGAVACRGAAWTLVDAGFRDVAVLIR